MAAHEDIIGTNMDMEPDVEISPDDLLFIIYTSGTTGNAEGRGLQPSQICGGHERPLSWMTGIGKDNKYVMIMPLFHIGGTKVFWSYFFVGGSHCSFETVRPRGNAEGHRGREGDRYSYSPHPSGGIFCCGPISINSTSRASL